MKPTFLFWQPKHDLLRHILSSEYGNMVMVLFNYSIWYFLLFAIYLNTAASPNAFWQMSLGYLICDFAEKFGKAHQMWKRPLFNRKDEPPAGLVKKWYNSGSFPSGHTMKAVCFFLFTLQYHTMNPLAYILIVTPLIVFRVLVGFHYPVDILGGGLIGLLVWLPIQFFSAPELFNNWLGQLFGLIFN